ncbi:sugar efflux transporter [Kalamiella sp. sgz302252]|uniref:sugar efflux transporter n=1 Tax=Pantoea sp. sgz302252 TaxID=3341827 RepID=UPI0036D35FDF
MAVTAAFLLVAFFTGIAGAFQIPVLSLYLAKEVKAAPAAIGFFYMVNAATGILIGFGLAALSDRIGVRRHLLMFCYFMAILNGLLFAFHRHYLFLLIAGSFLTAVANAATPQLFALAREHDKKPMFNALMRAQLSLAWVVGPPLAFSLTATVGFTRLYLLTAAIFTATLLLTAVLPANTRQIAQQYAAEPATAVKGQKQLALLFFTSMLMWSCSALYLIDAPVFIIQQSGLAEQHVGIIMGLAAALEIPVMLLAARYVERLGKKRLLIAALYAGMLFYGGFSLAGSLWQLLILQIFNAVFIGIISTTGMFIFQAALPARPGLATTLFTNSVSVGIVLAGGLHAFVMGSGQHKHVYIMAVALLFIASVIMRKVEETFHS